MFQSSKVPFQSNAKDDSQIPFSIEHFVARQFTYRSTASKFQQAPEAVGINIIYQSLEYGNPRSERILCMKKCTNQTFAESNVAPESPMKREEKAIGRTVGCPRGAQYLDELCNGSDTPPGKL